MKTEMFLYKVGRPTTQNIRLIEENVLAHAYVQICIGSWVCMKVCKHVLAHGYVLMCVSTTYNNGTNKCRQFY